MTDFTILLIFCSLYSFKLKSDNPNIIALSVACPLPVKASDPCNETLIEYGEKWLFFIFCKKLEAAIMGPIVWELDGPNPILNISSTD